MQVPKGNFPVERIRIAEKLDCNFKKAYWFQVRIFLAIHVTNFINANIVTVSNTPLFLQFGDDKEVIYVGAVSEAKQCEWIKALKQGEASHPLPSLSMQLEML